MALQTAMGWSLMVYMPEGQYHCRYRHLVTVDCKNDTGTLSTQDVILCPTIPGDIPCTLVCVAQFDQPEHSSKQAMAQVDQTSLYWSIHVHMDTPYSTITTTINDLLNHDANHGLEDAVADAATHQHHCAMGTEMCFDTDLAELDVTKAMVQSVIVALEAQEQEKHQQHLKHKHAQISPSLFNEHKHA